MDLFFLLISCAGGNERKPRCLVRQLITVDLLNAQRVDRGLCPAMTKMIDVEPVLARENLAFLSG